LAAGPAQLALAEREREREPALERRRQVLRAAASVRVPGSV
jgi:hypothetical protein